MSLKNEAGKQYGTKAFYKEYTDGMTAEQIGRGFQEDSTRIKSLYEEAVGHPNDPVTGEPVPVHERFLRFFGALGKRLSPIRRLVFGASFIIFFVYLLLGGPLQNVALTVGFISMIILLLLELLEKLDAKREIDLARDIQLSLLPDADLNYNGIDYVSFANTAQEVGGDYLDVIDTPSGTYLIIADVAGKGLSAALYMVKMQAMVKLLISKDELSPRELLLELNDHIKSGKDDKTFVTACVAYFPRNEEKMVFARAGHNPPYLYSAVKDSVMELRSSGFALGMTGKATLKKQLKEITITFQPGDSLLMYTDGLNEARNSKNEEFGEHRLYTLFELYGSLHAASLIHKVQSSLENFIEQERLQDDITFTAVHRVRSISKELTEEAKVLD